VTVQITRVFSPGPEPALGAEPLADAGVPVADHGVPVADFGQPASALTGEV
jgi:hypothetical protein